MANIMGNMSSMPRLVELYSDERNLRAWSERCADQTKRMRPGWSRWSEAPPNLGAWWYASVFVHVLQPAYILLDQHRAFVGCSMNSAVMTAAEADVALASAFLMLELKSDISGSGKVDVVANVFSDGLYALLPNKKGTV